jgi:hypothetical protein
VVFLHPLDLVVSTKTCLNNMVSPNDHVVMNHQNELMAYEAMFATISPFLVIYDNTTKASIN